MVVIDFLASDWSPGGQCGYIVPGQNGEVRVHCTGSDRVQCTALPYIVPGQTGYNAGAARFDCPDCSVSLDMLNNFCFHVYAEKSLSHSVIISLSHYLTLSLSH